MITQYDIKLEKSLGKHLGGSEADKKSIEILLRQKNSKKYFFKSKTSNRYNDYQLNDLFVTWLAKNRNVPDFIKELSVKEIESRREKYADLRKEFYSVTSSKELAEFLEIGYGTLVYYLYQAPRMKKKPRYEDFSIPKKGGKYRQISVPHDGLKLIQRRLNFILNLVYRPTKPAYGFIKSYAGEYNLRVKNIIVNARQHKNRKFVINVDIKDFFPSIVSKRIFSLFTKIPFNFNKQVAGLLSEICSHDIIDGLPQGAPTSPIISNMVCRKLDKNLIQLAANNNMVYTRYADDITFSVNKKTLPENILNDIKEIIIKEGFEVNKDKVRIIENSLRQEVTGLIVNEKVNVPRKYIRNVRAMLYNWSVNGLEHCQNEMNNKYRKIRYKSKPKYENVLKGRIEFIGSVRGRSREQDQFETYAKLLKEYLWLLSGKDDIKYQRLLSIHKQYPSLVVSDEETINDDKLSDIMDIFDE